jgi:tetratricopeptide (TPR) repeat protein
MRNGYFSGRGWFFLVAAACSLLACFPCPAFADELDQDFEFASKLIDNGFPDYADKVVQNVLRLHPDQKDRAKLIQAQILISRRKFSDAEEIVKTMGADNPKAQAISLALAKGYYVMGELDKSKQLYDGFFKQYEGRVPTDPDLLRFYQDSAYQFGQMLETAGDKAGAIKAYGRVLTTNPDKNISRRIMAKQAELDVQVAASGPAEQREPYLNEAKKLCETIQWGGLDIWFGQSIITMAHIQMVKEDRGGAQKVIQKNLDILKEIDMFIRDSGLPMSESPMAGARFLLGELLQQDAEALEKQNKPEEAIQAYGKALGEFYNVFAKYGDSEWGPQAGVRAQSIKTVLQVKYGKKVNVELGAFQDKAAEAQFRLADNLFRQKKYQEATTEYLKNLNNFPETDASVIALGNLLLSYANIEDTLMVKTVTDYLGERFSGKDPAAMALLAAGKFYFDRKDESMYMVAYNTYLKYFPKHPRAAGILFTLAGLRRQTNDLAGATQYYQRIVDGYPNDQFYTKALNQMAWGYFATSNYEGAIQGLSHFIREAQPGPEKAQAQFALSDCYRQLGKLKEALAEFTLVLQWLAPKDNPYATSAADVQKNHELLEKAAFYRGYCLQRIKDPPEAVADYRAQGIKAYDQFIALFPQSKLAPKALNGKGTIQLELGQFDAAAKTFDDLAAKYPQSDEGKSALFSLVRSAMEIKQYDQAKSAFDKMMTRGGYTPDEFTRIGQMMLDAGLHPQAIQAFQQVAVSTQERGLLERSLFGLGKAYFELKKYPESIKALEDLMVKYPKSGLFYDAKFTLGGAYRETGSLSNAVLAMSDVLKYANTNTLVNKASMELGYIQEQQDELQAALASFSRVALLGDPADSQIRPLVEQSILKCIDLSDKLQRYQDELDSCDQYLKLFPTGAKIEEVRKKKADAKLKAVQAAAAPAPVPAKAPAAQPQAP